MQLQSTLTCPMRYQAVETIPTDACQFSMTARAVANGSSPSRAMLRVLLLRSVPCPDTEQLALLLPKGH